MPTVTKIVTDNDGSAITPKVGTKSKGTALAEAGQMILSGTLDKSAVFGAQNLKAVYMKKKKATGYEYEAVDFSKIGAMTTAGWTLAGRALKGTRSFSMGGTTTGVKLSEQLYCKVHSEVTIGWKQRKDVFDKIPVNVRTFMGQTQTAGNKEEVVIGGNFFAFSTPWNGIPKGTLIAREALKAKVRYAQASDTTSGVYSSYCIEEPVEAP
jgi:hypothetical protein